MNLLCEYIHQSNFTGAESLIKTQPELINQFDEKGMTPLAVAAHKGFYSLAQTLIHQGADVNAISPILGSAVIHFAAERGYIKIIEFLISHGADITLRNIHNQYNILHYAILGQQYEVIDYLLARGFNTEQKTDIGMNALALAITANPYDTKMFEIFSKYVAQHSTGNPIPYYIICRKLTNIFNKKNLTELFTEEGHPYNESGTALEALQTLMEFLRLYISNNNHDAVAHFTAILKHCEKFYEKIPLGYNTRVTLISTRVPASNEAIYFLTGFEDHVVYGRLCNINDLYNFSLFDRGFFTTKEPITNKVYPLKQLEVTEKKRAQNILMKYLEASNESQETARDQLLNCIPRKAKSNYQTDTDVKQKPYSNGGCYFENLKSLLLGELIRFNGIREGTLLYKQFDLFMHTAIYNEFKQIATAPNQNKISEFCEALLETKQKKLLHLTKMAPVNIASEAANTVKKLA